MALATQISLKLPSANGNNIPRIERGQISETRGFDLRVEGAPWEVRRFRGRALRDQTTRESQANVLLREKGCPWKCP